MEGRDYSQSYRGRFNENSQEPSNISKKFSNAFAQKRPNFNRHRRNFRENSSSRAARIERSKERNEELEKELFDDAEVEKGINFDQYDDIPVEVSGEDVPPPIQTFDQIENAHPQLIWNIERCGYTSPTPVQKHSIAISVSGRDIMSVAQTGSGKTAAFLLPMVQVLLETGGAERDFYYDNSSMMAPIAVVLTPTRELAIQIQKEARKFLYRTGMRSCSVYGGIRIWEQLRELRSGVDILVATPGRLCDFLERGEMTMRSVRFLVMDEADRMLDMGFEDQIQTVLGARHGIPPAGKRQTMMFSATFPQPIQLLAQRYLGNYVFVAVGKVGGASMSVKQELIYCDAREKRDILLDFFNSIENESVLIFVQRKVSAADIERFLTRNGVKAMSIHGDKTQKEREYAINSFKCGICKTLVATDVASRGLDIPHVAFVFNFDMTSNIDDYVHRIGRTGRIGNEGIAITIISDVDNVKILQDLRELLTQSDEAVPDWLPGLISQKASQRGGYGYSGGRGRRRGAPNRGRRRGRGYFR